MGHEEHQQQAAHEQTAPVRCGVVTISDTRTPRSDTSGQAICTALEQAGQQVLHYAVVEDTAARIVAAVHECRAAGCQVLITSGGTGIAQRDTTFEAIDGLLHKRIPGFGELFRMLSYQEIGSAAMLSRAMAGVYQGMLIFCLPGSTAAVRLALEQLILPELTHMVWELHRQADTEPPSAAGAASQLSHLDEQGNARMVDVSDKAVTLREAVARGSVQMQPETLRLVISGGVPKGDVLAVARVAGIMAARRTPELIPLCHTLLLTHVAVTFTPDEERSLLLIEATVRTRAQTGVEMEALVAVSSAALTVYDMCKAIDREMRINHIRLARKSGGRSGNRKNDTSNE
jgi:molybdenum cofactor biosynthesis protein MoaC